MTWHTWLLRTEIAEKNMFHPHNGIIAEPTQKNIENASKRSFSISFPFLLSQKTFKQQKKNTNNEELNGMINSQRDETYIHLADTIAVFLTI